MVANARKRANRLSSHDVRFPGESKIYRKARDKLLNAEVQLRRHIEDIAALRRRLPTGAPTPQDYEFDEGATDLSDEQSVRRVKLSELFQPGRASLVIYSFMYGPDMPDACPMCTAMLDSLNGASPHATQRINLAVVAKSPIQRIRQYARERGWHNLRLLSSAGNTYNRDYHGETADGEQVPILNVFVQRRGKPHHFYSTELVFTPTERGMNQRHVDSIWPLWNLFDFTPEGRGKDWYPALRYDR